MQIQSKRTASTPSDARWVKPSHEAVKNQELKLFFAKQESLNVPSAYRSQSQTYII